MSQKKTLALIIVIGIGLCSCRSAPALREEAAPLSSLSDAVEAPTQTAALLTATPEPAEDQPLDFVLGDSGPYWAGNKSYTLIDQSRGNREIRISIWYPAAPVSADQAKPVANDAQPYQGEAPYPVILTGRNSGDYLFSSHLASHGFAMVIVRSPEFSYEEPWNHMVIDGPLDFLFVLQELSLNPPQGLEGILDTDRVGAAGYSWDGFFSLALSGVRIDPENYQARCAQAPDIDPTPFPGFLEYYCGLIEGWDALRIQAGSGITDSSDGLWQPITDPRIKAVMPMAPDGAWLYGERGLAAVQIPTLLIAGTNDGIYWEAVNFYEHLINSDVQLISFINQNHMMVFNPIQARQMNHFATAFFGFHLQGRSEYGMYLSGQFVSQFDDLAWGPYGE